MDIKTKYNVGDIVFCIENIGSKNSFSIRGLLNIARINIEVISPKSKPKLYGEATIKVQYGFRASVPLRHGSDYYWVEEANIFAKLKEAGTVLKNLGYIIDCEEEKERIQNGGEFSFLALKEDNFDTGERIDDKLADEDIPF